MDREDSLLINKIIFYILAISCPFVALIMAVVLSYQKNPDKFLDRIKLISIYELFEFLVIGISFIYWGTRGIKISIFVLLVLYLLVCGSVAYNKKDYISRGIVLGLFANHYSLAVMQTSEDSRARTDNSKWPDFGLAVILMIFKLIFILLLLLPLNSLITKISSEKITPVEESSEIKHTELKKDNAASQTIINSPDNYFLEFHDIHFIANSNLFLSEGDPTLRILPEMTEGMYKDRLKQMADDMNRILKSQPEKIFVITGWTIDISDNENSNIILSKQRADRVKNILIDLGIPEGNLICTYMGGTNNWGNNKFEEQMKPNRVVTIEIR